MLIGILDNDREYIVNLKFSLENSLSKLVASPKELEIEIFTNPDDLLSWIRLRSANLLLIDADMPEMSGFTVVEKLRLQKIKARVVILTAFERPQFLRQALEVGCQGFLTKNLDGDNLATLILQVTRGQIVMGHFATEHLVSSFLQKENEDRFIDFQTKVEQLPDSLRNIFFLIAQGLPNRIVAKKAGLSEKTVRTYSTQLYERLGCTSRTDLAVKAAKAGLI